MSEALRLHLIKQFLVLCVPFATFNEHVQFADHFTFNLSKAIKKTLHKCKNTKPGVLTKASYRLSTAVCLGQPSIAPLAATLGKCYWKPWKANSYKSTYWHEVSFRSVLALDHVKKDGNCGSSQLLKKNCKCTVRYELPLLNKFNSSSEREEREHGKIKERL